MSTPPRNAPCPCGSGKKYKHCCIRKTEEAASLPALGDVDGPLAQEMLRWLMEEHPDAMAEAWLAFPSEIQGKEYIGVSVPLAIWEITDEKGCRIAEQFRALHGPSLEWEMRQCLDAHLDAWFSVWEVLEVFPEEGIRFRDLLTGEERTVREKLATRCLVPRHATMARILRFGASWALANAHPHVLRPEAAAEVVRSLRRHLGIRTEYVDPERLKGEAAWELFHRWQAKVDECSQRPRPRLTNTESDPLLLTTDRYTFDPENREEVVAAVGALEGVEVDRKADDDAADDTRFVMIRPSPSFSGSEAEETIVVARLLIDRDTVVVETNSTRRADDARRALEEADVGLHHEKREQVDPYDAVDALPPKDHADKPDEPDEPDFSPEEKGRIMREFKERHYATWVDTPLPCLGGSTPREASKDRRTRVWRDLDLTLREMECHEATLPPEERFDVGRLRRDLGLPE